MLRKRGGLSKSKAGMTHDQFFIIFDLILAGVVFTSLLFFINGIKDNSIFERNYIARDTALLLNTLYAAPGDVSYLYKEPLQGQGKSNLLLEFSQGKATLTDINKKGQPIWYPFGMNKEIPLSQATFSSEDKNGLLFEKSHSGINIKAVKVSDLGQKS